VGTNAPKHSAFPTVEGVAFPRVGLLGNPSDGFEGRCLAFTFDAFRAAVRVQPQETAGVEVFGPAGLRNLVVAGLEDARSVGLALPNDVGIRIEIETTIPRQVGLSGSSAVIVALLRALERHHNRELPDGELAACAWRVEANRLGIACGPLDRAVQVVEGLVHLDFVEPLPALRVQRLHPVRIAGLFLAWDPEGGDPSGEVHQAVRSRVAAGEHEILDVMRQAAGLADEGLALFERGGASGPAPEELADLCDRNFAYRASVFPISPRDHTLVNIGRSHGAGVKQAGSGGAVIGVLRDPERLKALQQDYAQRGFRFVVPHIGARTQKTREAAEPSSRA